MSPSLREVLAKAHGVTREPLKERDLLFRDYYAPRIKDWFTQPESERVYSQAALDHMVKALSGGYKVERAGRLSPSAVGTDCERELLFAFLQAPQSTIRRAHSVSKMDAGTFEHIRHQMIGLSAGYLTAVEIFVHDPDLRCGGSADGRGDDGSLFELKNTASHLFVPITKGPEYLEGQILREADGTYSAASYAAHMVDKHKIQMECYWLIDELEAARTGRPRHFTDFGSLVYQEDGSKKIYELRIKSSPQRREAVRAILESARGWIDIDALPERLEGCEKAFAGEPLNSRELRRHESCFYRGHCEVAKGLGLS